MAKHTAGTARNFSRNPGPRVPRSVFNRSHSHKTTTDVGVLVPILVDEILPGDTINLRPTVKVRLATPIYPLMDDMFVDLHFFAIPYRLVWDNATKFFGEQASPGDSIDYEIPKITTSTPYYKTSDYFGIRAGYSIEVSALPFRALNLTWNEWFRSQTLQTPLTVDTDDGPDTYADYRELPPRGKAFDYFTACLDSPQRGDAVSIPIGTIIPDATDPIPTFEMVGPGSSTGHPYHLIHSDTAGGAGEVADFNVATNTGSVTDFRMQWTDPSLAVSSTDINTLREQFAIQRLLERDSRGGTRYQEMVYNHFGVMGEDYRFQRPEFLGSMTFPMGIFQVPQTSETSGTPLGQLAAYGEATNTGRSIVRSFSEHSILLGLLSIRPNQSYSQGVPRMFKRDTRYEHYHPDLAGLGEQAVYNYEIFADGSATDDNVFGYMPRWDEYRHFPNKITGALRSDIGNGLDSWHLAHDFSAVPSLNSDFIEVDPAPVERAIAVPSEPHAIVDAFFQYKHTRPMPAHGIPGNMGRF